jgi:hypothetical protein
MESLHVLMPTIADSGGSLSLDKIFDGISDELPEPPVIHGRPAVDNRDSGATAAMDDTQATSSAAPAPKYSSSGVR